MLGQKWDIVCSSICDSGDIREINQDAILVRYERIKGILTGIFVVADGCGGLAHGERISRMIAERCLELWEEKKEEFAAHQSEEIIKKTVSDRMDKINEEARRYGNEIEKRVGSTMSMLWLVGKKYYIFHTGDSRVYRYHRGKLDRLTEDQSLLADKIRNHEITAAEAERFQRKNVLTMCVGFFEKLQLFINFGRAHKYDVFLLCSDGFYNVMDDVSMKNLFPRFITEDSALALRQMIPDGRAGDNISVIVFQLF